jgi:ribosome-associated heat shock protein Hsp15
MREDRRRLDKWLWFARFARTRSASARFVESGHVRVNGERVKQPAKALAVGDVITMAFERTTMVVRVLDLGERRGPATEARMLYEDLASAGSND